jgi:hypothetical protein
MDVQYSSLHAISRRSKGTVTWGEEKRKEGGRRNISCTMRMIEVEVEEMERERERERLCEGGREIGEKRIFRYSHLRASMDSDGQWRWEEGGRRKERERVSMRCLHRTVLHYKVLWNRVKGHCNTLWCAALPHNMTWHDITWPLRCQGREREEMGREELWREGKTSYSEEEEGKEGNNKEEELGESEEEGAEGEGKGVTSGTHRDQHLRRMKAAHRLSVWNKF